MAANALVTNTARANLDDSRALLARARKHFVELNDLLHPREGPGLWQTRERHDPQTGEWFYCLHMDRQRLIMAKPIIADSATNIASALDHIVAAIAKARGHSRLKTLYFPLGLTNEGFRKALAKVEPIIGAEMAKVIATARTKYQGEGCFVEAAKQISNWGKHWGLMLAAGKAHGIALHEPFAKQRIFEVPEDTFAKVDVFEYHRGVERLPRVPISILIGQAIDGLDEGLPNCPDLILECSFRFVEGVITAVEKEGATNS